MSTATLALLLSVAGAAIVLGALAASVRVRSRDGALARVDVAGLLVAALVAGVVLLGQLVVVRAAGGDLWDAMSVVYLDAVVGVPLIALAVLAVHVGSVRAGRPRATSPVVAACAIALLAAPLGWWMTHVGPYRLQVDEVATTVNPARAGDDPVRIGVLADLQTPNVGAHERRAVAELVAAEPDVVLVPGDLFQGTPAQLAANRDALRELLGQLDAPGGVFVVPGDVDPPNDLPSLLDGTPAVLLRDQVATTTVGDRRLRIAGVSLEPSPAGRAAIGELAARPPEEIGIVLAHRPDWVAEVPPGGADLVVAGHTHGGQIQLPGIGPLITMSSVPRHVAAGGLHDVGGTWVYVSTGVGREQQGAPQVRLLADPSVGVIDLVATPPDRSTG